MWWDHHDWDAHDARPGRRRLVPRAVRLGQRGPQAAGAARVPDRREDACDEVETRLQDAGIDDIGRSVLEQSAGREVLRVLVGPWSEVRKDTAARKLESGPEESGVYAMPDKSGRRIDLLDEQGDDSRVLGPGGGLLAATRIEAQQPTWVVTGVDETGVAAAAAALTEDRAARPLRDRRRGGPRRAAADRGAGAVTYRRRASPLHAARAGIGAAVVRDARPGGALDRAPGRARRAAGDRAGGRRRGAGRPPGGALAGVGRPVRAS